jgi:peptide/nickel transport system substrate-binding protein
LVKNIKLVLVAVAVVLMLIISGVVITMTASDESPGEQTGSVENLNIGYVSTAGNTFGWGDMGTYLFRATTYQESLIGMNSTGNFVPRLADSWETDDARTWTFHLTHNATWHDGIAFTASDVWFSINYTLEKKPWGMNDAKFMLDIDNVSMPDKYTIVIKMKTDYANLLNNVRIGLVVFPEHIYKSVDDPMTYGLPDSQMNATIGTGPYKAVSLDTTARLLKFTVNNDYYGGAPSVKNITVRFYSNADSMILALMAGEIDTVFGWGSGISYYYVPQILKNDNLDIILNPSLGINALNFNNNKEPFSNYTLRLAVSYALDYVSLRDIIQGGYGETPSAGIIPEDFPNFIETTRLMMNVTKANALLTSLGYIDIDGDGYRETPDGSKFQPQLILSSSTTWVRVAEIVEDNLQDAGIDVQLKIITTGFASEKKKRQYDMVLSGTSQAGTFAWESYYTTATDGNAGLGDAQVFDPEFQAIISKLRSASTEEEMEGAAAEIQQYYADNLPSIALYWYQIIQPYNVKYTGYGFDLGFGTIMCYDTYFNLRSI